MPLNTVRVPRVPVPAAPAAAGPHPLQLMLTSFYLLCVPDNGPWCRVGPLTHGRACSHTGVPLTNQRACSHMGVPLQAPSSSGSHFPSGFKTEMEAERQQKFRKRLIVSLLVCKNQP